MSSTARFDREQIRRFNRYWEDLMEDFPEARRRAVEAMGESVRRDLDAQINRAELENGAKLVVRGWQTLRFGSRGGYAAVSPRKGTVQSHDPRRGGWRMRQHTYKGQPVTAKQVTRWLERGHGVRQPAPGSDRRWRTLKSRTNDRTGLNYVEGRRFYSWARLKALDRALEAANEALEVFAEERGV